MGVVGWLVGGHQQRERPGGEEQNTGGAVHDGDQLVHLPGGLPLPDVRHLGVPGCCRHPDWLLHVRHHLQVWRRPFDLPDLVCQVEQGRSAGLSGGIVSVTHAADSGSSAMCVAMERLDRSLVSRAASFSIALGNFFDLSYCETTGTLCPDSIAAAFSPSSVAAREFWGSQEL